MSIDQLDLGGVRSLSSAMARTPSGTDAVELARRLGIWTTEAHRAPTERRRFPAKLSDLGPHQLADESAWWTSEFGRIVEMLGAINGQREVLKVTGKRARAAARGRLRRGLAEGEKITATALNDQAEEDPAVIDVEDRGALLEVLCASVTASKEATTQYLTSISREISHREAQMKNRMYG